MKQLKTAGGYLLRLDKDEKFTETILTFVKQQKIKSAWFSGLGAVQGVELGWYDLASKEYNYSSKIGVYEITNLTGNIAWQNNQPVVHAHITLTDKDLQAFGGHLKELIAGGTLELRLTKLGGKLQRIFDEHAGLNLLDL